MQLKPEYKIRREILRGVQKYNPEEFDFGPLNTTEEIRTAYDVLVESGAHWDFEEEWRSGEVETNIPTDYSRHYETKSVAIQTAEGDWIGWTFYYGGGKHGNPEEIEWMADAYNLECHEEEKLVVVRTFKLKEEL